MAARIVGIALLVILVVGAEFVAVPEARLIRRDDSASGVVTGGGDGESAAGARRPSKWNRGGVISVAGIDTTSKAIEWAMAELIKNPREMVKVQTEVRQVAGAQGVLKEHLGTMSRLHAAMKEAMRLHPPVPLLLPHEAIQDTKLHGYDIPVKTWVMINAWPIGRDNETWENAEELLPEKFMHSPIDYNGKDFRFIPFSAGRRGCPGIVFATRLAELALANLMYHFDWELTEGQDLESFQVVESTGLTPALNPALILVAKPLEA
ncbi:Cytochrome P450 71A1 [Dichanthelium oligosanthes]|uniref:Cytochrome P450 71A1 n=1 Tax=Dichanthelium oligosanthes TaxID=888268 RepID=A0A1E5VHL3_9POAL|nr:Cytochrome P450 71A1 [Dichanthelium oligosanthes]